MGFLGLGGGGGVQFPNQGQQGGNVQFAPLPNAMQGYGGAPQSRGLIPANLNTLLGGGGMNQGGLLSGAMGSMSSLFGPGSALFNNSGGSGGGNQNPSGGMGNSNIWQLLSLLRGAGG